MASHFSHWQLRNLCSLSMQIVEVKKVGIQLGKIKLTLECGPQHKSGGDIGRDG